jgi:hypothetical protein
MHQIVPIKISGNLTTRIVRNSKLVVYEFDSHGLLITQKGKLNADLRVRRDISAPPGAAVTATL